jgi:hypothetical protein
MNYAVATNLTDCDCWDMARDIARQRRFFNQIKQALKMATHAIGCMAPQKSLRAAVGSARRNPAQSANSSVVVVDLLNR